MDPNSMPPEILIHIFSHLQLPDTASVSRVSRYWHACSEKQLYSKLQLNPLNSSLSLLARTLLTPGLERLATHVHTLITELEDTLEVDSRLIDPPIPSTSEHVVLILQVLPRLQVLKLNLTDHSYAIDAFLDTTGGVPLELRQLHNFSCTWPRHQRGVTTDMLLSMFRLPCIRTLEIHILAEIVHPFPVTEHKTSGVTKLEITCSEIRMQSLGPILQVPRALTHLSFTGSIATPRHDIPALKTALEHVRMTLQVLELDTEHMSQWSRALANRPFLSLRMYPVLWKLKSTMMVLLGNWPDLAPCGLAEVLPPSLRELEVLGDWNWVQDKVVRELVRLVEQKGVAVPVLETVVCGFEGVKTETKQGLHAACEVAGVLLVRGVAMIADDDDESRECYHTS